MHVKMLPCQPWMDLLDLFFTGSKSTKNEGGMETTEKSFRVKYKQL